MRTLRYITIHTVPKRMRTYLPTHLHTHAPSHTHAHIHIHIHLFTTKLEIGIPMIHDDPCIH